jgi:hypothetical protein
MIAPPSHHLRLLLLLSSRASSGPVEVLRSIHGLKDLRVRLTATQPQIMFPYTDPQHDVDVSAQMDTVGGVELKQTKLVSLQGAALMCGCIGMLVYWCWCWHWCC